MKSPTSDGDLLEIPAFLRREPPTTPSVSVATRRARARKIPYPKDGYACKGMRQEARARHRAALNRRAERMRIR